MHRVIENELEDYLTGSPAHAGSRAFQSHLAECAGCSAEILQMQEVSGLFESLRPETPVEVAPGFHYRVTQLIESRRRESFWNVFSFDPGLARRVVFSSLVTLAILGSYMVSRESGYPAPESPSVIMARHDTSIAHDDSNDRGQMLVTLASFEQ
ncbi:MAG: anti-sigma factor family protein [Bryobacteraceae bacterium]